ncbi:MAG: hypothetical protein M3R29_02825 [Verrucomicrobiota bacterium]|nr:hypothetical protein [Verrucomicrobiota bacterium]
MPETIGKITNIKVGSFLTGTVNSFDIGTITIKESGTGASWFFFLWNSRDNDLAVRRILQTQRLALAREAAFRKLIVHVFHQNDSSVIDEIQVDIT